MLFLQSADATYRPLLEAGSWTVREYCARHGFEYRCHLGIVRGCYPWHASYNRIPLLRGLVESGYLGWVCYLDADAFVADLGFDLKGYLSDKNQLAIIGAPGGRPGWWAMNAGVLLINLAHSVGRSIVLTWSNCFEEIGDDRLRAAKSWDDIPNDQGLLHRALQRTPGAEQATLLQRGVLNYLEGSFIKQVLRTHGNLEQRIALLKAQVEKSVGTRPDRGPSQEVSYNTKP